MAKLIDGKEMAKRVKGEIKKRVDDLVKRKGVRPKLAVILVGEDPASLVYVRNKTKDCEEVGIITETIKLPANTAQGEIEKVIGALNENGEVDGILVQLPLPKGLDEKRALSTISPDKDVDGLHPENMGKLLKGEKPKFIACTPSGVMEMIKESGVEIKGKEAVVIGRSNIVGKPMALLLLEENATVTICHSRTKDLGAVIKRGDIVVAAVGRPELITGEMIKKGAIVIDVGMNRVDGKLKGDVKFDEVEKIADYITPVPGGVGPMTRAMLLANTIKAAESRVFKEA